LFRLINTNEFKLRRQDGGVGGVEEKKEKEKKMKIYLKISTKFPINLTTNG
jgi:hypothetical protein